MFATIPNCRIAAVRAAVPSNEISIEDELQFYGGSLKKAQRAKKMIGTDKRRIAWPGQTSADLCLVAAKSVFNKFPGWKNEIDAVIFISQTPDYDLPATACILQNRLELPQGCAAFDVNQGCAGFVYGLWLASSLCLSGCRKVLLMAGDVPYVPRLVDNRIVAPIFGDGGSACIVEASSGAKPLYFSLGTDGSGYDAIIMPAGRARLPFSRGLEDNRSIFEKIETSENVPWILDEVYMNGPEVFNFTMRVVPEHVRQLLAYARMPADRIDWFLFHQANRQIISEIARKADLPLEKTPSETFSRYGNLSSASVPAAICDLFGEQGSTGKTSLLLSGYGVGLSWASCVWEADNCDCAPVIDAPKPEEPTREEKIEYWIKKIRGSEQ